jgi:phosphatidate phosphatase APP1
MPSPFLLVSDLDDTLKISHTTNRLRMVFRGLFTKQSYAGMSELYQEWTSNYPFILLSSSPIWIRAKIERFLSKHGYPEREIWLRDWIRQKDIRGYKSGALAQIESRDERGFIFVGDDAEHDPEVFDGFRRRNPERTLAIYVRRMRGRPLPAGATPFHSALEIALSELKAGRLKVPQVARIAKAIADEPFLDCIIPRFATAPTDIAITGEYPTLENSIDRVNLRYEEIRKERKRPRP